MTDMALGCSDGGKAEVFGILTFLFITFAIGYFLICLILKQGGLLGLSLKIALAFPLGFGTLSLLLYCWLHVRGSAEQEYVLLEIALMIITGGAYFLKGCYRAILPALRLPRMSFSWMMFRPYPFLLALVLFSFLISGLSFIKFSLLSASGGWDAWAMWNMKARFVFEAGTAWQSIFSMGTYAHPDYPLLLPLSVVRGWLYLGVTSEVVPIVLAVVFTLTIPALMLVALSTINKYAGLLGSAFLLGSTQLLVYGTSQYADIPLSAYFLAAIILVYLSQIRDRSFLFAAGLFTGFSLWTKNEGFAYAIALVASIITWLAINRERRPRFRNLLVMLIGMLIVLVFVFHFKQLTLPNDIWAGQSWSAVVDRLTNPDRYGTVWRHLTENLLSFCGWQNDLLAVSFGWYVAFSFFLAVLINPVWPARLTIPALTCTLLVFAYFVIYLITPQDIEWHLLHSLDRLMLQLLPMLAFVFFGFLGSVVGIYRCSIERRIQGFVQGFAKSKASSMLPFSDEG